MENDPAASSGGRRRQGWYQGSPLIRREGALYLDESILFF
jgi:hypothetical protein